LGNSINSLEKKAFHEAGHIVVAYLSGYSCKKMVLSEKNPIENRDIYDFGKDSYLISAMYQYKNSPEAYDNLPEAIKSNFRKVSLRTIIVLLGGPAAENIYKNGGKVDINQNFSITGIDFEAADKIDYFLSMVKQGQHATNYLKVIFRQVLTLMEANEVWNAISTLANSLLNSQGRVLEKKDVQKILIETGFLHYLGTLKQGKVPQNSQPRQTVHTTRPVETIQTEEKNDSAQVAQPIEPEEPVQPQPSAFSREELLRMKEEFKKKPKRNVISKKEGTSKIAKFAKGHKFVNFKIGMIDSIEQLRNIDKSRYVAFDVKDHSVARDILMYFICMGMEVSPGSTQNNTAASIFVVMDELISPGTGI